MYYSLGFTAVNEYKNGDNTLKKAVMTGSLSRPSKIFRFLRVDPSISASDSVYDRGMQRELDEETIIDTAYSSRCIGMINDDETDVGKVHLGVVHIFDVTEPKVRARESDIIHAEFDSVDNILNDLEVYESWSQICLKALFQ